MDLHPNSADSQKAANVRTIRRKHLLKFDTVCTTDAGQVTCLNYFHVLIKIKCGGE